MIVWTKLGSTAFPSKAALAADPCHEDLLPDLTTTVALDRIDWEAWKAVDPREPNYVARLALVRPGASPDGPAGAKLDHRVSVDSAQAGFFDPSIAGRDNRPEPPLADFGPALAELRRYRMCCARTLALPHAGLVPHGVVSASGWGDGSYDVFVRRGDDGAIEAGTLVFLAADASA